MPISNPPTRIELDSQALSFTRPMADATGDVSYAGYRFKPRVLIAIGQVATTQVCVGFGDLALEDHFIALRGTGSWIDGVTFLFAGATGTDNQYGTLKSLDSDGFTITWTKAGSPTGTFKFKVLAIK
ncbi:unnamed protein product [marine sediment metagenome]|uniref:Uncharacterized protein n=1 Tax=marine sediment metagenome TaxID=412755 RepID=X1KMJ4_9ZZZZ